MSTTDKSSVIVELYDLPLTPRKDDRFGRVIITKSLNEDDLIAIAVAQRTDLNANTLKASIEILRLIAMDQVANGASVRFGLSFYSLGVSGVFIGDNAGWDPAQHSLTINSAPISDFRLKVKATTADVRGMAASGPAVNSVIDVTTGLVNTMLTPGGGLNITGNRIKIDGDNPDVGISLINQETKEVVPVPKTSIIVNDPSKISIIIPAGLANGDYKLSICTQYSNNTMLKEPRTFIFEYILNVTR